MNRPHRGAPLLAGGAATLVAVVALVLTGGAGTRETPPSGDPPLGAVVSDADREAVGAVPVERGAEAPPVDPAVDLTDPEAVARTYLTVAHSLTAQDAGRTHLRAAGYAVPGSPPADVGVVVLDPPLPGSVRAATVTGLELVAAAGDGVRRGYRAEVGTATGPPGSAVDLAVVVRDIVLARQPDGRWLVTAESSATPDLPAGED